MQPERERFASVIADGTDSQSMAQDEVVRLLARAENMELLRDAEELRRRAALRHELLAMASAPNVDRNEIAERFKQIQRETETEEPRRLAAPTEAEMEGLALSHRALNYQTPPYDVGKIVEVVNNGPAKIESRTIDKASGRIQFTADAPGGDDEIAEIAVRGLLGFWLRPRMPDGSEIPVGTTRLLRVQISPAYSCEWENWVHRQDADTKGELGLSVISFELNGRDSTQEVDKRVTIWEEHSWWSGEPKRHQDPGREIGASLYIDGQHEYLLSAEFRTWNRAEDDGWAVISPYWARSTASVSMSVPYIAWAHYPNKF